VPYKISHGQSNNLLEDVAIRIPSNVKINRLYSLSDSYKQNDWLTKQRTRELFSLFPVLLSGPAIEFLHAIWAK